MENLLLKASKVTQMLSSLSGNAIIKEIKITKRLFIGIVRQLNKVMLQLRLI